ncbi:uncharacterized protein LOC128549080 isoform X1 [Mercenaria mercenaria]|uniref:uncharacterized protein LOC128549080 isoform X1 n=1 Tax=Mercenaria mercenaria TaxID=6596 RepID=UPI00234F108E|nr:uncharacterized protein LOC128549080 isoform X1 [Mercenaria mercenaria]XP_053381246.1 uncharacterized protein LOC128549080 isoform X1 [Mercenaria mercenaria]XP_053381247.1 uncharacterized protein LOC128549080 isoform X1 [Mercenaria mercenaria]
MDRGKKTSKYAKLSRKATVQTDNSPNPVAKPKRKISVKSKDAKKSKTKQTFPANDKPTSTVPTKDNKRKRRVPKRFQDDAAVTVPGKDQSEYSSASESDSDSDSDSDRDSLFNTITEHTSMLAGNGGFGNGFQTPVSTPISSQICKKLKKQIWADKFINMADLLPQDSFVPPSNNRQFMLQMDNRSNLSFTPSVRQRKLGTIEAWTSAFLRFVAIYTEKFPAVAPALMKYGEIIRDLASRRPGQAWQQYDSQFRQLRSHTPVPWDSLHFEYWMRACTEPSPTTSAMVTNRPFRSTGPQGPAKRFRSPTTFSSKFWPNTCWTYNRRGECRLPSCNRPHICGFCKQQHYSGQCIYDSKEQAAQALLGTQGISKSFAGHGKQASKQTNK